MPEQSQDEPKCWLDRYTADELGALIAQAHLGEMPALYASRKEWLATLGDLGRKALQRAAQRQKRQNRKIERRELMAHNLQIWRGEITEPLPDHPYREVRTATHRVMRGNTTDRHVWQGVELPAGTVILVNGRLFGADVIGHRAEIIRTPERVRVHVWSAPRVQEELTPPDPSALNSYKPGVTIEVAD